DRIERNAVRMTAMVQEILEAAQLEARMLELQRAVCDLRQLASCVVSRMDDARARRVAIEADGGPHAVFADASRVDRAITNLLTNALKFSPPDAGVRVVLTRSAAEIFIRVIDSGIGIAPEEVGRLFDRFQRAPGGRHMPGVGLGLYI